MRALDEKTTDGRHEISEYLRTLNIDVDCDICWLRASDKTGSSFESQSSNRWNSNVRCRQRLGNLVQLRRQSNLSNNRWRANMERCFSPTVSARRHLFIYIRQAANRVDFHQRWIADHKERREKLD